MDTETIIDIFSNLGSASVEDHSYDNTEITVMVEGSGFEDWYYLETQEDRILWIDFSHATDLGPLDGSEILERLQDWEVA